MALFYLPLLLEYYKITFIYFVIYINSVVYDFIFRIISRYPTLILEMIDHITKFDGLLERAIQDDDMVCIFDVFSSYSMHENFYYMVFMY